MRFRQFEPHKSRLAGEQNAEISQEQRKRALPELQEGKADEKKRAIPLEWRTLAPFIETYRSQRLTHGYSGEFWRRLLPRLRRAIRQDELVREYLRRTFWRRWALRAVAASALLALAFSLCAERERSRLLRNRIDALEKQIQAMQETG
jgi:anti-sigma-K factor RskA